MSLRWKAILINILPLLILVVAFGIFSRLFLLGSFSKIEADDLQKDVVAFANAINGEIAQVARVSGDWAPWDDSYDYMAGEKDDFLEINVSPDVLANLRLSGMIYLNLDGSVQSATGYDLVTGEEVELSRAVLMAIQEPALRQFESVEDGRSGILLVGDETYLAAANPITSSNRDIETNGTMVVLRKFDETEINLLGESLGLDVFANQVSDPNLSGADWAAYLKLNQAPAGEIVISTLSADQVVGHTLMNDLLGNPALLLHVERERSIYRQGNLSILTFIFAFVVAGLFLGGLTILVLDRSLLTPLIRLDALVAEIGHSRNLTLRSDLKSTDEIGSLAQEINRMLDALQQSEDKLTDNQQRLEWITENMVDVVSQLDKDWNIIYISPSVRNLLGYRPESMIGFSVLSMIHKEDRELVAQTLTTAVAERATQFSAEYRFPDAAGSYRWLETQGRVLYGAEGEHIGAILGARDISQRIKAEEKLHLNQFSLQHATEGILWLDQTSVIMYANEGAARILGYSIADIQGKTISQFDMDLPQSAWSAFLAQAREQAGSSSHQDRFRSREGRSLVIQTTSNFTTFAGRAFVVIFLRKVVE